MKTEEQDNGDLLIILEPEELKKLGWKENDTIEIVVNKNGTLTLMKNKMMDDYMSENVKIDLTGTHEDAIEEIDKASISDEFKVHLWKQYNKEYDEAWNSTIGVDLDTFYEESSIPISELVPKGMTIKEYFGKEQRLLRGENISYMYFD